MPPWSPWDFDRKPYGDDRAPADAAVFAYTTPDDRADALAVALGQYNDATARIKAQAAERPSPGSTLKPPDRRPARSY
ncbi:hypothetical protein OG978_45780 (plasmid) [Streptomyces sp. NBC_01591]|uniref:hypothetical protein n=1 Tax=Streptomyces sp. NBC_01591 TaxID=2975888 RepID=UPI002DDC31BE|nr:hypothetical protein [Streptomyces sp. NBC_01591]WSD74370.1 hypothetical protein OG978_45780 [Streptomyces sp. NBC_01591]